MKKITDFLEIFAIIAVICLILFLGCYAIYKGEQPDCPQIQMAENQQASRFSIQNIGYFQDADAYHNHRKIYILTDRQTGVQYIGISGVGISEMQSRGKAVIDE